MAVFLILLFVALAVAGIRGWTADSRDSDYSLRLQPYREERPTPPAPAPLQLVPNASDASHP